MVEIIENVVEREDNQLTVHAAKQNIKLVVAKIAEVEP